MPDNSVLHGRLGQRTDEAAIRPAACAQPGQTEDCPPEEAGWPMVLDAYDPLLYRILLIVLTAVVSLLLQALGFDATLQLFSRLVRSVGG